MFSNKPKYQKLTSNLKIVINRLKLLEKKKTENAIKGRKEVAEYLAMGKEDRARIRVEHIIREDYLVEAMELVEMFCDLLLNRMGLLQSTKNLDEGLEEPIASIIWSTPRLCGECKELLPITEQLTNKYGKDFAQHCKNNTVNNVNEKLVQKLSVHAPPPLLVDRYLQEIAKTFNLTYKPKSVADGPSAELVFSGDGTVPPSFRPVPQPRFDNSVQPESNAPAAIGFNLPNIPSSSAGGGSGDPNFDDLAKRFDDLKKR